MKEILFPTRAVNLRKEAYDIFCGRGSKWGNPFTHLPLEQTSAQFQVATREEAIEAYEDWFPTQPKLVRDVHKLKGLRLGCYCKPRSCHCDFLARKADESYEGRIDAQTR
jgi:hypothetical protein